MDYTSLTNYKRIIATTRREGSFESDSPQNAHELLSFFFFKQNSLP